MYLKRKKSEHINEYSSSTYRRVVILMAFFLFTPENRDVCFFNSERAAGFVQLLLSFLTLVSEKDEKKEEDEMQMRKNVFT